MSNKTISGNMKEDKLISKMGNVLRTDIDESDYMSTNEVLEILSVARGTLTTWARKGEASSGTKLHWYKYKRMMYFCKEDIKELMKYY